MTYPPRLRDKARVLRREKKLTIDEIAERLAAGRTTAYLWVHDMPRPTRCVHRPGPAHRLGSSAMQRKFKLLRDESHELGFWEFPRLARDPEFRDFVGMYIGEGYKRSRNTVQIGNSDPAVIAMADRWIREFTRRKLEYSIQHHADQSIEDLAKFWASVLPIEPSDIKFQRKSNSGALSSRVWRCKYGVISIRTHDTLFRARLQGWIDHLQASWLDSPSLGA